MLGFIWLGCMGVCLPPVIRDLVLHGLERLPFGVAGCALHLHY